jgi:DNA-binding MarR family transcriptional regulator
MNARATTPRAKRRTPETRAIEIGPLSQFIGFNLRLAQDASFRAFAGKAGEAHLRPGRFAAMMVIHNNPGITQIELGRAIARDKSSVTPLLQELQRQGHISRRASTTDRRSVSLRLTKKGERVLKALLGHAMEHDRRLDAIVGAKKAEFLALLKKIADEI